jgi:predicted nucleic acid-binding protein
LKELTVTSYIDSLSNYRGSIEQAIELKSKIPIFLDTNVLLRYYSVSFKSRQVLLRFFNEYKSRIFITAQVQREFIKNREDVIERYFEETLSKLKDGFKDDITNKIKSYTDKNKILLDDFKFLEDKLSKLSNEAAKTFDQLTSEIEKIKEKLPGTKYDDDLLAVVKEMNLIDNLSEEETKYLHSEYDLLKKGIEVAKVKTEITKPQRAFPGAADLLEKPDNPYGDYLIYHEIVKFMKERKSEAMFLTYDTTKGDWLKDNKEAHTHYIQTVYLATKQNLFFIDADRFFNKHLKQHFESLLKAPIDYYSPKLEYEKDFILDFVGLERIIRTIAEFVVIDDYEKKPLPILLREFLERKYIDKDFLREFYDLNNFKNLLTHSHDRSEIERISKEEFLHRYNRLEAAIDRMNKLYSAL